LIDFLMPGMDGFMLAETIRRDPALRDTEMILLTSSGQRGDSARCRELGMAGYLLKPVAGPDLMDALRTALGRERAGAEPGAFVTRHSLRENRRCARVLLAEDNPVNRMVAVRMLQKRGHSVLAVEDGLKAVAALKKGAFDVVLMDVQMPGLEGYEATAAIRDWEKATGRHTPIIALTAHARRGDRDKCLAAGMDAYVSKPIRAEELMQAIDRLLSPDSPADAGAAAAPGDGPPGAPGEATPGAPGSAAPAIDREDVLRRLDGDAGLLAEIVQVFRNDGPKLLASIREALSAEEWRPLEATAHRLKGSLGTLSARAAAAAARRLEEAAASCDLRRAASACRALERELQRLEPELAALDTPPPPAKRKRA
jgi:CheY-like chemotaxis protein/HPt (histidine-containing phosphotransfer) domain-containing protein